MRATNDDAGVSGTRPRARNKCIEERMGKRAVGFSTDEQKDEMKKELEILYPKLVVGGVLIIDDYGHHPEEIKSTIEAVRLSFPKRRVLLVFQHIFF